MRINVLFCLFIGIEFIYAQPDTSIVDIQTISIEIVILKYELDLMTNTALDALQGCLCDPVFCRELGVTLLWGYQVPRFGVGIEFSNLFPRKLNGQFEYRGDFDKNYIINTNKLKIWNVYHHWMN